jgi:hypothetical protein
MTHDTSSDGNAPQTDAAPSNAPAGPPPNLKMLKLVAAGLGVVFVVLFITLILALVLRSPKSSRAAALPGGYFGISDIAVAPGEKVRGVTMEGDRLAIHVGSDGAEAIIIVNAKTGEELGRILLTPMSGFASR